MPKIVLPPLTPKEINARDDQENLLNTGLSECWRGEKFDEERAEKLLRAYAIEIFNTISAFYRKKNGFQPEWFPDIVNEAVFRAKTVYSRHRSYGLSQVVDMMKDTVTEHLRNISTTERGWSELIRAFPTRSTLIEPHPDGSPLLQVAKAQVRQSATPNPQPEAMPSDGTVIDRRAALLSEYIRATGANDYQIYNAQNSFIHKPEFYQWKKGKLPEKSKTAKKFEAFLKAKRRPIRKNPTA
jgi:hypothetical protein